MASLWQRANFTHSVDEDITLISGFYLLTIGIKRVAILDYRYFPLVDSVGNLSQQNSHNKAAM